MSKRLSIIFGLAFALGLPLAASAPARAASFPFTCQIGTMNGVLINGNAVVLNFTKSNGPASSGLQPGQCAFEV
jgi:hypothetical protein